MPATVAEPSPRGTPPSALLGGVASWTVLRAKRLLLRPVMPEDAGELRALLASASDDARVLPCLLEELDAWITETARARRAGDGHTFVLLQRSQPIVVGAANLRCDPTRRDVWQIGYWVAPAHRRQRYGSDAAAALVEFAFTDLAAAAIEATVPLLNAPSIRVLRRLRFRAIPGISVDGAQDVGLWQRLRHD